jgi:serine protease Do
VACKGLDAQFARPEDTELAELINRFVPLRILNMKGVDLNTFRFDYDLTFAVLMMDAEGRIYSRFGSRDARSSTDRVSIPGLKRAMREVLRLHQERPKVAPPPAPPVSTVRSTLEDLPNFKKSKAASGYCYHCHFVQQFRLRKLWDEGKFSKEMLFSYPLPENVGLTLEVDRNNVVKTVAAASPAGEAGLQPGDTLLAAGSMPVLTSADLQFVLNQAADPGKLALEAERSGRRLPPLELKLPAGWKRGDISWRASSQAVPPSMGIWGEPLSEAELKERALPRDRLALRVTFLFPGDRWARTRGDLRMNDVILGWNGLRPEPMDVRQLHSYWRLNFKPGDRLTLDVLRNKLPAKVAVECMEVPEE